MLGSIASRNGSICLKRLVVDRIGVRADLQAVRVGVQRGWLFKQRAMMGIVVLVVHGRCVEWLPIAQGEEEFLVVLARVVAALDIDEAELARVGTPV